MLDPNRKYFHAADYVVFVAILAISVGIGIYHALSGGRQRTTSEYLLANRQLRLVPVAISMTVSVISANTLLGVPTEAYTQGVQYGMISLALVPATIAVVLWFVPLLYPLKMVSVHEYLFLRYGSKVVRLIGTGLFFITQVLYVGTVIYGPATALEAVTGIPAWASILLVSVIGTIYTVIGGIKAVIWTDVFQSTIMLAGLITLIAMGTAAVGGFNRIVELNDRDHRLNFFVMRFSFHERYTFFTIMIGFFFFFLALNAVNQPIAQRYAVMPTLRKAQIASVVAAFGMAAFTLISMVAGMVMYGYYAHKNCDPFRAGYVKNPNQVLPYYVLEVIPYPGLPGLFTSCLFSASLSTISSSVNSLAAVVWSDIFRDYFHHWSDARQTMFVKCIAFFFGVVCMLFAYLVSAFGGTLIAIAVASLGVASGPLVGLFILGCLFPHANWKGASIGAITGLAVNAWCLIGSLSIPHHKTVMPTRTDGCYRPNSTMLNSTDVTTAVTSSTLYINTENVTQTTVPSEPESPLVNFYKLGYSWYPAMGCIVTVLMGLLVSLITLRRTDVRRVPPETITACIRGVVKKNEEFSLNKVGVPEQKPLKDVL